MKKETVIIICLAIFILIFQILIFSSLNFEKPKKTENEISDIKTVETVKPQEINSKTDNDNKSDIFYSNHKIAYDLLVKEDYQNALVYFEKALKNVPLDYPTANLAVDYTHLANSCFNTWKMEKAKKYYETAIIKGYPKGMWIYERLGDTCYNLQQWNDAEKYYRLALEHIYKLYQEPEIKNNPDEIQKIKTTEEKIISILNGTFVQ